MKFLMSKHSPLRGKSAVTAPSVNRASRAQIRIGNTIFNRSSSKEAILNTLLALKSPLSVPNSPTEWIAATSLEGQIALSDRAQLLRAEIDHQGPDRIMASLEHLQKREDWITLYLVAGELYCALLENEYHSQSISRSILRNYSKMAYGKLQSCETVKAVSVEQREYGVTNKLPIGTHNLQDCLGIFVYDRSLKAMGLAHLDLSGAVESLGTLFSKLSTNRKTVTLIGSRFESDRNSPVSRSAENNILDTIEFLMEQNVEIRHAEVGSNVMLPATAVCGNPKSGTIWRAMPRDKKSFRELLTALAWGGGFGASGNRNYRLTEAHDKEALIHRILETDLATPVNEESLYERFVTTPEASATRPPRRRVPELIDIYLSAREQAQQFMGGVSSEKRSLLATGSPR